METYCCCDIKKKISSYKIISTDSNFIFLYNVDEDKREIYFGLSRSFRLSSLHLDQFFGGPQ